MPEENFVQIHFLTFACLSVLPVLFSWKSFCAYIYLLCFSTLFIASLVLPDVILKLLNKTFFSKTWYIIR